MRTVNIADIENLEALLEMKLDKISGLEKFISNTRGKYSRMTEAQFNKAVADVAEAHREIDREKIWCDKAQKQIAAFFAPACA